MQGEHLTLWAKRDPLHVLGLEVIFYGDLVVLEDGQVAVEILTLVHVDDDRLVLNAHEIGATRFPKREHGALELPRRRVGARHREVPRDVVFEDCGSIRRQSLRPPAKFKEPLIVGQYCLGACAQNRNFGFLCHRTISSVRAVLLPRRRSELKVPLRNDAPETARRPMRSLRYIWST